MNEIAKFTQKTKTIDLNKQYHFPHNLTIVKHKDYILIIASETVNWIVLENEDQLFFFELLKKHNLKKAIEIFNGSNIDIQHVIIQIEAKKFENLEVYKAINECTDLMHVYLTNECNMRCPHCYMSAGLKKQDELTTYEVCNLIKQFKENGGKIVVFSGGEICTRIDLLEILTYAKKECLQVQLITNGTLWNDGLVKQITSLVSMVRISIDGYSEKENAKIRGKGNFSKALSTLDKIVKSGVKTELAITPIFDETLESKFTQYVEFGKSLKTKYSEFDFNIIFSKDLFNGRDVQLNKNQRKKYSEIMNKIDNSCNGSNFENTFIAARKKRQIIDNCTFGSLNVSSEGNVYFCAMTPNINSFANIRENSIEEIIKLSKHARELSKIDNLKPCKNCELRYICSGECRIIHFKELAECDIAKFDIATLSPRICDKNNKEIFYDLMIKVNNKLFE